MRLDPTVFVKLGLGAFLVLVVGFMIRGTSTVVVGSETAQLVAAPVFVLAVVLAALAFVLAVPVKLGIVDDADPNHA